MTTNLTNRDRAILRAVAGGTAEMLVSSEPDLFVDGRFCCDQLAARRLAHAGLIAGARPGQQRTLCLPDGPPIAVTLLSAQPAASTGATRYRGQGDTWRRSRGHIAAKPARARNHVASTRSLLGVEVS